MSDDLIASLDAVDARGVGVRVEFFRRERRVGHRIALVEGAGSACGLVSVEGDSRQAFPPSPPLQQLATEALVDGSTAVLLLGMAGRGHWSVSVESRASERLVRFDVACRVRGALQEQLHGIYQLVGPWQVSADGSTAVLRGAAYCLCCTASRDADCPTRLHREGERLVITPTRLDDVSTHRWRYELALREPLHSVHP